jgi:hypothetical protein
VIIVRLQGGLGNQLFQYAFARSIALRKNIDLKIDISLLGEVSNSAENAIVRYYDLDFFKLKTPFANKKEIELFNGKLSPSIIQRVIYKINRILGNYPLVIQNGNIYNENQINGIGNNACIVGRWQSESFFIENSAAIKKELNFNSFTPNKYSLNIANDFKNNISIGVHIRRGDYYSLREYSEGIGCLSESYYFEAINYLKNKFQSSDLKFYFISDDIDWCKKIFISISNSVFVEQEKTKKGYISDLWLLKQCKHVIISNSTFAWWGAYLSENNEGLIVAPLKWARTKEFTPESIIPDRWIKLDNTFEKSKFDKL